MLACTVWYTAVCSYAVFGMFRMNSGPCLKMAQDLRLYILRAYISKCLQITTSSLHEDVRMTVVSTGKAKSRDGDNKKSAWKEGARHVRCCSRKCGSQRA